MVKRADPAVAASAQWVDEEGIREPGGDVHAWHRGTNQTLCGLSLYRTGLSRFPHVLWIDARWLADTTDRLIVACHRCAGAVGGRRDERRWTRKDPRP
jgi:hypothetical protein